MGPWFHASWLLTDGGEFADIQFPAKSADDYHGRVIRGKPSGRRGLSVRQPDGWLHLNCVHLWVGSLAESPSCFVPNEAQRYWLDR